MALFTLVEAQAFQAAAKVAYTAAIGGKRYEIKDRMLARQDIEQLLKTLTKWTKYVDDLSEGNDPDNPIEIKRIVPVGL